MTLVQNGFPKTRVWMLQSSEEDPLTQLWQQQFGIAHKRCCSYAACSLCVALNSLTQIRRLYSDIVCGIVPQITGHLLWRLLQFQMFHFCIFALVTDDFNLNESAKTAVNINIFILHPLLKKKKDYSSYSLRNVKCHEFRFHHTFLFRPCQQLAEGGTFSGQPFIIKTYNFKLSAKLMNIDIDQAFPAIRGTFSWFNY